MQILEHQLPILEQLEKDRNKGKTLVVIPSGAGKTHIAAFDSKAANAKTILYLSHRREILRQASTIFKEVHQTTNIGFLTKDDKDFGKPILFATNSSLANRENLEIVSKVKWDYLVVDEFHHVAAETWSKIVSTIKAKFVLGLTATPYRLDKKDIMSYVDNNLSYELDLEAGIKKGILVPFHYNGLHDDIDYSDIKWQGYKYRESDLEKKLLIDKRDEQITKEFLRFIGKGHQTIAFCVNIEHTKRMMQRFEQHGISSRRVTHKTSTPDRDTNVRDFLQGKYDVLFVRDVFNEGVDFPNVEAILLLRPTWSKNVFFQQIGRGLRKAPGKKHVTILDFIGNYNHAFDREQWLHFAEKSEEEIQHKPIKPMYKHNVPYVHFNQRVIDIFETQRLFTFSPNKQVMLEQYFRFKKLLGRRPVSTDFDRNYAKHDLEIRYTVGQIMHAWGSWNNFIKALGEPILLEFNSRHATKSELIEQYYQLAKHIGGAPFRNQMSKRLFPEIVKYPYKEYAICFGSWRKFLNEIGEPKKLLKMYFTNNYFALKKQLKHQPTLMELDYINSKILKSKDIRSGHKYWKSDVTGRSILRFCFGNYAKFLKELGEPPMKNWNRHKKQG